ncbi:MAG: 16S rRNA (cytosine(1402)-N(4))-methyltransferase RsmH [Thiobacillaceae bacterium]
MSIETPPSHVRRKRYRNTHPRKFEEKYKELNPQKFAADVEKVIARGQTPAGMHRSICVDEILAILNPQPGETGLDATLGFGGHTRAILPRLLPGGRLFAVDVDSIELPRTMARLRGQGFSEAELVIHKMNFAGIAQLLPEAGGGFDCILADLGVSSMQLDDPARGFSYKNDGPLDLRLNPMRGMSATALLQSITAQALAELLTKNADEPHAELIAQAIKTSASPITTTRQLAELVRAALNGLQETATHKKTLARTFQALRIAVNDEFGVLDRFLEVLPWCMKPGARVAVMAFHSGEDRRVEQSFEKFLRSGMYSSVAPGPLRPSPEEQRSNPRSTSTKLRWAIRSALQAS